MYVSNAWTCMCTYWEAVNISFHVIFCWTNNLGDCDDGAGAGGGNGIFK